MELQVALSSQNNFEREKKIGGLTILNFKIYYEDIIIVLGQFWTFYQRNTIESPEINLYF